MNAFASSALIGAVMLGAPATAGRDAAGPPAEVASFCRAVTWALHGYGSNRDSEFRHVVVYAGYGVGTIRIGPDVFNVTAARVPGGWTEPYVAGPAFPNPESLTATGMPRATASAIAAALGRLDDIPLAQRKAPCA